MRIFQRIILVFKNYVCLWHEANDLSKITTVGIEDPSKLIDLVFRYKGLRPSQKRSELKALLEIIKIHNTSRICEIGNYKGGTLFLIAQIAEDYSKLISVDIKYPLIRQIINQRLVKPKQILINIKGNSNQTRTFKKVQNALKGEKLDLLFIDGDHSYEGVKCDYENYSKLVREGGFIIFHDIHPDSFMSTGIKTPSYVGGVPKFWQELKEVNLEYDEVIENLSQDGMGLGILINS